MTRHAVVTALALAAVGASTSVVEAQQPLDPCALLKPAEIQSLAGTAKVGAPKADTAAFSRGCQYEWGTGANVQSGKSYLTVSVSPLSQAFPGLDPAVVQQGLLGKANGGKPNTAAIAGVGDAAIYESNDPIRVETTTVAKGYMLIVAFESADARARKDLVIRLLKAATGRL